MLNEFAKDVSDLTGGEVKFEILPQGAVVGVQETLDAVDKGLIEGGFAWTHYWSGKHPAAMLFAIFVGFPISFTLIFLGFVFMDIMMEQACLMEHLFRSVQLMPASTRGSLYIAVLFVSTIFAAATGIVGASVTILGIMAAKTMNRSGDDVRLAAGTIAAGGTLGILVAVNLQTAWLSPPVALSAYFLKGVVPEWDLKDIYVGMIQFMGIQLIGLILILIFPQIALWLPAYIYGG